MNMKILRIAIVAGLIVGTASAADPTQLTGNAEAGKKLASKGAGTVAACASCHGAKGEGQAAAGFPRLAGLSEYYLRKQLNDYQTGHRSNQIMQPVDKSMSPRQIADVAAYYASLQIQLPPATGPGDAKLLARGQTLAELGDESKRLQACANCHGPRGMGLPPAIPALAGQPAAYLKAQLQAWKGGTRKNDGGRLMGSVAAKLDDEDMDAVAQYYTQARPDRFEPVN
jgi:cytochrome c553